MKEAREGTTMRYLKEMLHHDMDVSNPECYDAQKITFTSYPFLGVVFIALALLAPIALKYRLLALQAKAEGSSDAAKLWKKAYLALGSYSGLMILPILFMEGPENPEFSLNVVFFVFLSVLLIHIGLRDFQHKIPVVATLFNKMPEWTWAKTLWELSLFGFAGVGIPFSGTWALIRCYNLNLAVGHMLPGSGYVLWALVMGCFMGTAPKSHSARLRLLLAESYIWLISGFFFQIYYSLATGGGFLFPLVRSTEHTLWVGDQQHGTLSMCWFTSAIVSRINVACGFSNSFHYLLFSTPVVMAMIHHPKECHREELAHQMHGVLVALSLLFRGFNRIYEASLLMFAAAFAFMCAAECLIVFSVRNQVVAFYLYIMLACSIGYWTYVVALHKDFLFDTCDNNLRENGVRYSKMPVFAEGPDFEGLNKGMDEPESQS